MPRWTPERRERMRALIRERKPWLKSTGPVTADGKKAASRNARRRQAPTQEPIAQAPVIEPPQPRPSPETVTTAAEPAGHGGFFAVPMVRRRTF
jgi:hypothetical protein